jgi:hypothetical protein
MAGGCHRERRALDWLLGAFHDQGLLHSDFLVGQRGRSRRAQRDWCVSGRWLVRKSHCLERFDGQARYALIVTIRAPGSNIDIFTLVETVISVASAVET